MATAFSDASTSQHEAVPYIIMYVKRETSASSRGTLSRTMRLHPGPRTPDPGSHDYFGIPCSCAEIRSVEALGERRN
jgi:hypothetical protein